jgi:hypothetical protein
MEMKYTIFRISPKLVDIDTLNIVLVQPHPETSPNIDLGGLTLEEDRYDDDSPSVLLFALLILRTIW